jgi:hypothetical protein
MLFHGRVGTGIILIVFGLAARVVSALSVGSAVASFILAFCLASYFGIVGNDIAWETGRYATIRDLHRGQIGWNVAGIAVGLVTLALNIFALVL